MKLISTGETVLVRQMTCLAAPVSRHGQPSALKVPCFASQQEPKRTAAILHEQGSAPWAYPPSFRLLRSAGNKVCQLGGSGAVTVTGSCRVGCSNVSRA